MAQSFINFENQVCLITGAGSPSGIGFSAAKIFGSLGAKVALTSTTDRIFERVRELEDMGITAKGYAFDLMDRKQAEEMVSRVISDFGSIDVLVNNAGMVQVGQKDEDFSHMLDITYESWDLRFW